MLYVTLEPCLMCAAAMVHARVRRVVFGAFDPKAGAAGGMIDAFALKGLNHRVDVFGGVLDKECGRLLSSFLPTRLWFYRPAGWFDLHLFKSSASG